MINMQNNVNELTPSLFIQMLKSGAKKILAKEKEINAINVFPVSDHDTGTNIAGLMRFLLAAKYTTTRFSDLFKEIADSSLIGAAGNSGMIFSAFFSGLSAGQSLEDNKLSTSQFLTCIKSGVNEAYKAVAHPIEGTVLTVMQVWVAAFKEHVNKLTDFASLFEKSINQAELSLTNTQHQLPILEENHVVDAGAYAFMLLLKGMHDALRAKDHDCDTDHHDNGVAMQAAAPSAHELQSDFHYCFESILLTEIGTDIIRSELAPLGDSLAINKSPSYVRVHLHTNDLIAATQRLKTLGTIQSQKVDDMRSQFAVTHQRKHPIALVIDSSADLPQAIIDQHQIHVIPVQIRLGQHNFLDGRTITLEQCYNEMYQNNLPASTSIPSPEAVFRQLKYLAAHYESIIVITLASHMSGLHQLVTQQAKKIQEAYISVFDSRKNSVAHGLMALKAAELIAANESHDDIITHLDDMVKKVNLYAMIHDFKALVKSGRAPKAVGFIADLAHFKPIITTDLAGKSALAAAAFGDNMSEKKIIQLLGKRLSESPNCRIALSHSDAKEKADKIAQLILEHLGMVPIYIHQTSAAIGLHAGRGCVGVGIIEDN